jgi:hypothetical protein
MGGREDANAYVRCVIDVKHPKGGLDTVDFGISVHLQRYIKLLTCMPIQNPSVV